MNDGIKRLDRYSLNFRMELKIVNFNSILLIEND